MRIAAFLLCLSLLLTGCNWPGGSYVSVTPHQEQRQYLQTQAVSVADYTQLCAALERIVSSGAETATLLMSDYPPEKLDSDLAAADRYICREYPIGAYAVKELSCEVGTSVGQTAVAVMVEYHHGRSELLRIRTVYNALDAAKVVTSALVRLDASIVLQELYDAEQDFTQLVQDYARENPQLVMEIPQVTQTVYGSGAKRVVELIFTYQTDRESLRRMQTQVKPVFDAAVLYVSGDGEAHQKYSQLYGFLMERFDYKQETSITPSYSLLRHGVGDSRAFATVYAAMCKAAGLPCTVVTGTHSGKPWTWNIVQEDGYDYHVDLLRCTELEGYHTFTDAQMEGYVWDYSAYPPCPGDPQRLPGIQTEPTEPTENNFE